MAGQQEIETFKIPRRTVRARAQWADTENSDLALVCSPPGRKLIRAYARAAAQFILKVVWTLGRDVACIAPAVCLSLRCVPSEVRRLCMSEAFVSWASRWQRCHLHVRAVWILHTACMGPEMLRDGRFPDEVSPETQLVGTQHVLGSHRFPVLSP